jgi:L-fuculose-phosphate aldolase
MRHHGTVVVADTPAAAHDGAAQLEWLCDVWLRASSVGAPSLLSTAQVDEIVARMSTYGQPA